MSNFLKGLSYIVQTQSGASVLNLSTIPDLIEFANKPNLFVHNATVDVSQDPNKQYSLVLTGSKTKEQTSCEIPCLETQEALIDLNIAALEWGARCCTMGGLLVSLLPEEYFVSLPQHKTWSWLCDKGTVLVFSKIENLVILVYRHKLKQKDYMLQKETFETNLDWSEWASGHAIFKTGVCTEDPGPLELKNWNIRIVENLVKNNYIKAHEPKLTYFYKSKNKVSIRWENPTTALEWAQQQALHNTADPSWDKTVERFNQRLGIDTFINLIENTPLNKLLDIPQEYSVILDSSLKTYLKRKKLQMNMTLTAYPEKSTIENRYFTLGPGSRLARNDGTTWKINFSEPDFGNYKPPRLHIEQEF
jgi:hypothetical protein